MSKNLSLLVFLLIIKLYLASEPEVSSSSESSVESAVKEEPKISDVIDLTSETDFNDALSRYNVVLVEFFAPWCGYCQALAPDYEKAATQLKLNDPPVTLAKVDCNDKPLGEDKCKVVGVPSLPTLKVFKNGIYYYEYKGPRNEKDIVDYMKEQLRDASKQFETADELDERLANTPDVTVLGVFERSCSSSKLVKDFQAAADKLRDTVPFVHVFVDKVSDAKSIKILKEFFRKNLEIKPCNIIMVRPVHIRNKFESDYVPHTSGDIVEFVQRNKHGLVGHKTLDNRLDFQYPIVVVFYDVNFEKNTKMTKYWRNRVLKVAAKHPDLTFVIANKNAFSGEIEDFGLQQPKTGDTDPIVGARSRVGKKYTMKDNFTVDAFEKFIDDFKNERLVPFVKSQELPTDNENAGVKVLVANNFEDMIFNVDKDHLILFYNPRDGYCKALEPFYIQLGEEMRNEPDVQISKIDATGNDILATFPFRGFPTIYFYSKNKTLTPFEGEGKLKDMIEFVAKHATRELIGYDREGNKIGEVKEEL